MEILTFYTLEQGLRKMIEWIKQRGPRPFNYHLEIEIKNKKTPKTWLEKLQ